MKSEGAGAVLYMPAQPKMVRATGARTSDQSTSLKVL
jgi:hypothetical protein